MKLLLLSKRILLSVFLATFLINYTFSVAEESPELKEAFENIELEYHKLRFYLHPDLKGELTTDEVKNRLVKYVEDLNFIFAKQTIRRFTFNPDSNLVFTLVQPHSAYFPGGGCDMPRSGYEIWIHAVLTDNPLYGTYGGSASFDSSGAGVASRLKWDAIHDRDSLTGGSDELKQYWRQLNHITHEVEHIFGAGISEYYNLNIVKDSTMVEPIHHINLFDPEDLFWGQRQDYWADPLTINIWDNNLVGNPTTYEDLMNTIGFANVTVAIINSSSRRCLIETLPDLNMTQIYVTDEITGLPLTDTYVSIWKVRSVFPYTAELIVDNITDPLGMVEFEWGGTFSNFNNLFLVKAFHSGYESKAKWASIFDAQEEKMVHQNNHFPVHLSLRPVTGIVSSNGTTVETNILKQNYPNPFNSTTTITFSLEKTAKVNIKIYNSLGRLIRILVNETESIGENKIVWDGKDDIGQRVASGAYFYQVHTDNFTSTKKMILLQ